MQHVAFLRSISTRPHLTTQKEGKRHGTSPFDVDPMSGQRHRGPIVLFMKGIKLIGNVVYVSAALWAVVGGVSGGLVFLLRAHRHRRHRRPALTAWSYNIQPCHSCQTDMASETAIVSCSSWTRPHSSFRLGQGDANWWSSPAGVDGRWSLADSNEPWYARRLQFSVCSALPVPTMTDRTAHTTKPIVSKETAASTHF